MRLALSDKAFEFADFDARSVAADNLVGCGSWSMGRLDGFFHNKINIWDVAAGALLVEEAGGIVNDLDKFDQNNIDIRASSGAINDKMLENLKNF